MTTTAIIMMIVAIVVVWGGLVASILHLRSRPEVDESELSDPDRVSDPRFRGTGPVRDD